MGLYAGIDPGKSGAVAFVDEEGKFVAAYDCPETDREMASIMVGDAILGVAIEKAQAMPRQGVSSTFKFGENYGLWKGICTAYGVPYLTPHPTRWKKILDGPTNLKSKERVIEYVSRRWPEMELKRKKDHNRADAICLAEYARREFRR